MRNQETILTDEPEKPEDEEDSEEEEEDKKERREKKVLYYKGICPKCRNNCGGGRLYDGKVNFFCKKCKNLFSKEEDYCNSFLTCDHVVLQILDDLILKRC